MPNETFTANGTPRFRMKGSEIAARFKRLCYCGSAGRIPEVPPVMGEIATGSPAVIPGQLLGDAKIVVLSQGTGQLVRFAGRNVAIGSVVYDSKTGKTQVVMEGEPEQRPTKFAIFRL